MRLPRIPHRGKEASEALSSAKIIHHSATSGVLPALLWASLASWAAAPDYRGQGHDHYFNLEYDEAIADYRRLLNSDHYCPVNDSRAGGN